MSNKAPFLLQGSMKVVQSAVNRQVGVRFPALEPTKKCSCCKLLKTLNDFYKNRTRKDGRQNQCIECEKTRVKILVCSKCGLDFHIKHRNIRKRKSFQCSKCVDVIRSQRVIELNKSRQKEVVISTKGYIYVSSSDRSKYVFKHRRIMEIHLGRKLLKSEVVHHIDGNRLNNSLSNLWLTDSIAHRKAHHSLEILSLFLYENGLVGFDPDKGIYFLKDDINNILKQRNST